MGTSFLLLGGDCLSRIAFAQSIAAQLCNLSLMSPRHWFVAGWLFIAATAGLAIAGAVLVLNAVSRGFEVYPASSQIIVGLGPSQTPFGLMLGVVLAVLAGVAFFSGMACFFWGAMLDSRQRMAEILQSLHQSE
jgi:hypothetical protein